MKQKINAQMSFDLSLPNLASIDEIAAQLNTECAKIINEINDWPGNIICLVGAAHSGAQTIFENWQIKNQAILVQSFDSIENSNILSVNISNIIDENLLFSLFQLAENNRAKILIYSAELPQVWQLSLPDLQSRVNSLPLFAVKEANESHFAKILYKTLNSFGINPKKIEIKSIFRREICSFALLQKIFSHICVLVKQNELPNDAALKVILSDFAHSEMNKDLFDDHDRTKGQPE